MKYLTYVGVFILLVSVLIGYQVFHSHDEERDAAIIINDRIISHNELAGRLAELPDAVRDAYGPQEKGDFIQSLITKELMIQESQRLGIDRDEAFRRSVESFYEQSLIKILMDRKYAELKIKVTDRDVNRYLFLLNKEVRLQQTVYESLEAARGESGGQEVTMNAPFSDLTHWIRNSLMGLEVGESSEPVPVDDRYVVYTLLSLEPMAETEAVTHDRVRIRKILRSAREEAAIHLWLADLKREASIKIMVADKDEVKP